MNHFLPGLIVGVFIMARVVGALFRAGRGYWRGWPGVLFAMAVCALVVWMMATHWGGSGPVWLDWPWRW